MGEHVIIHPQTIHPQVAGPVTKTGTVVQTSRGLAVEIDGQPSRWDDSMHLESESDTCGKCLWGDAFREGAGG